MSHTYAEPAQEQQRESAAPSPEKQAEHPASPRPISCGVPGGAPQGGLLDWFRGIFGTQQPQQPQEPQQPQQPQEPQQPQQPQQPDEVQQWVEDAYGEVNPAFVTDKPEPGSPLANMVQPYPQEGPGQAPVFETHSFMPRQSQDHTDPLHLHSFIGLRFTQMDPAANRFVRKRLKAGFGGGGHFSADQGVLMNDNGTQADMSTETPITKEQLEAAMDAIPAMAAQPYHALTHNCNDFTKSLADMVGASVPAQLHDTMLGPIRAYKNLANAAEGGPQGRTRFFQGGGSGNGQMSAAHNSQLIEHFPETARTAARRDGVPFLLNPSLREAADQVAQAAVPMRPFLSAGSLESEAEERELENITSTVSERAEAMIHLSLWKGHPRVNIAAMKVIAIANQLHSTFLPERRPITNFSPQEIETVLTQQTGAEKDAQQRYDQNARILARTHQEDQIAGLDRGVRNQDLFSSRQSSLSGSGDIFLQSMGLSALSLLRQHRPDASGSQDSSCAALLRQIDAALTSEDGMGVNDYLSIFFRGRDNLTDAQLGAMAVRAILNDLKQAAEDMKSPLRNILRTLELSATTIAASRLDDSLENNDQANSIAGFFTGNRPSVPGGPQRTPTPQEIRYQEGRQELLDLTKIMEAVMAAKFEAVRAHAQQGQAPQE